MPPRTVALLLTLSMFTMGALAPAPGAADRRPGAPVTGSSAAWTVADLYASPAPYALGHRGYGADAVDPSGPLENSLDAFHQAFQDGIRVVELDLQRTADGKIVVFHDDFLQDFTCVSAMTYDELLARHPQVPLFRAVLNSTRHFGRGDQLGGILFAEIKTPAPLCDGANTSQQAEVSESALVAAVVDEVRAARMEDRVILNSASPSILRHSALQAPEIRRALSLNALQLLSPEDACRFLPPDLCPPVRIPRNDCGLEWYNIGPIARLPRYLTFQQFVGTALGCAASTAVSLDRLVLLQNPAVAPGLVAALHGAGLEVIVWTVDIRSEWDLVAGAGVDGITTNNIALGLDRQAPLQTTVALGAASSRATRPSAVEDMAGARLALHPLQQNPSRGGTVRVDFTLPDAGAARLELMDVAGRLVEAREVGALGPGRHAFTLGRDLRSGVYLVRLRHAEGAMGTKVAVVR